MPRQLQALVVTLDLSAESFRLRAGTAVGACPRSDTAAVAWDLSSEASRGGGDELGANFEGVQGDRWTARARLEPSAVRDGGRPVFQTDTEYDTGSNGPRTARTPTLEAAGLRAWLGVELAVSEPDAATSVLFRLYDADTGDELYWTGAEWAAGASGSDNAATWSTAQVVQDNLAQLPGNVRRLAFLAWLRTSSADYSPAFYGARVAYGVRQVSPLADAMFRTLLASLRDELEATGVLELVTSSTLSALELGTDGDGPEPFAYSVSAVDAVFNLTDDPDELIELPGTLAGGTWTPDTPIPSGKAVRVEFRYTPDLVARRHPDLETLARLPAVYLVPSGPPSQVYRSQGYTLVRDVNASPPVALELPDPEIVTVPLELRVVAELGADVDRLAQALTRWISTTPAGGAGLGLARELVSPETGQVVHVQAVGRPTPSPGGLAQGVSEARAAWLLTFPRASAHTATTAPLVNSAGPTLSTALLEA